MYYIYVYRLSKNQVVMLEVRNPVDKDVKNGG